MEFINLITVLVSLQPESEMEEECQLEEMTNHRPAAYSPAHALPHSCSKTLDLNVVD